MRRSPLVLALFAVGVAAALSVAALRIDGTPVSGGESPSATPCPTSSGLIPISIDLDEWPGTGTPWPTIIVAPYPTPIPCGTPMPTAEDYPADQGMSLSGPAAVSTGQTFTITISADPAPSVPVSGFATEVLLPPALIWIERPTCEDENQTTLDGGNVGNCIRAPSPGVPPRHVIISAIQAPPLPALDTPLDTLLEIDLLCIAPGVHTLSLTAVPASSFGAVYFDDYTEQLHVRADSPGVADTLDVTCTGSPLRYTPTSTGTPTYSPTATSTPCPDGPCPTPTTPPCPGWPPDEPQPTMCLRPDCDSCGEATPTPVDSDGDIASGPGPGMSLDGPGAVTTGQTFTIEVNADPPPDVPIAAYYGDVLFPYGLSWLPRPMCEDENQTTANGEAPAVCTRSSGDAGQEARHTIASDVVPPAQYAIDTPIDGLLQLDVACTIPGTHTIGLIPYQTSPYGALYLDLDAQPILLKTTLADIWDTEVFREVADTLTVVCTGESLTPTPCPAQGCPTAVPTPCAPGGCPPGMSLSAPGAVSTGQTFTVDVSADPPPGVPIAGFASEVVLPPGLSWVQRPTCRDENQATVQGGNPLLCVRGVGENGEARHIVGTAVDAPPLPALDTPVDSLVQIDVVCTSPGTHTMALTAVGPPGEPGMPLPGYSPFGAAYFQADTQMVLVKTVDYDIDGDTQPEHVADTTTVVCTGEPLTPTPCPPNGCPTATPTLCAPGGCPTNTPTLTRTPTPTATPCAPEGCPTSTPFPPTWTPTPCPTDGCIPPGMALTAGNAPVPLGQSFMLFVISDPVTNIPMGGFQSEVLVPDGLSYVSRSCQTENQATVNGGSRPAGCTRAVGPQGELWHVVVTCICAPPLKAFDAPLHDLLAIQLQCVEPGLHELVLTAIPHSPYGAAFFDTNTVQYPVPTIPHDIDGDTSPESVADTLTINCSSTPPHTATGTPQSTATRTATPTFTLGTPTGDPDASGATPMPDDPTPSPTRISETSSTIITPTATDFSDVSPALATPRGTGNSDIGAPDAGSGPGNSTGGAPLAVLGVLSMALFALLATILRRTGAT